MYESKLSKYRNVDMNQEKKTRTTSLIGKRNDRLVRKGIRLAHWLLLVIAAALLMDIWLHVCEFVKRDGTASGPASVTKFDKEWFERMKRRSDESDQKLKELRKELKRRELEVEKQFQKNLGDSTEGGIHLL
jgi:hypothetical protein